MAIIRSKNNKTLDRIRTIVGSKIVNFNGRDRISTIQRYLIVLYLANIHPLFQVGGKTEKDKLRYFSGPKLDKVARKIGKEWGTLIEFDRYRTTRKNYEKCQNEGYVQIDKKPGDNMFFALTKKGKRHCEEIITSSYRMALSKNLSRVRVIAIDNDLKRTHFLAIKEDSSLVVGTADGNLKNKGIKENSLIEYIRNEQNNNFGEIPYRIEQIDTNSLHISEDDSSVPMIKDMINTDIRNLTVEDRIYYVRGKIIRRWSPDDEEGVKEIEDVDSGVVTIQDSTGEIDYVKLPYDTGWREERIRVGTWVEALGIFKSGLRIRDFTMPTSLYAPYKVEFFRPLNH